MKLIGRGNAKTVKGEKEGFMTFIMHLAPSVLSGFNTCPMASAGCAAACLNTAGRGRFTKTQEARIAKTRKFFQHRHDFMLALVKDIRAGIRAAAREGMVPVFRLNGTSDIRWETVPVDLHYVERGKDIRIKADNIFALFPNVTFYDYTKLDNRKGIPDNYHLTFSRSESNDASVAKMLGEGFNVAVVFNKLPETYLGRPVIDGTETDLRFLDPKGVIVGLLPKGKAKTETSGFVVDV